MICSHNAGEEVMFVPPSLASSSSSAATLSASQIIHQKICSHKINARIVFFFRLSLAASSSRAEIPEILGGPTGKQSASQTKHIHQKICSRQASQALFEKENGLRSGICPSTGKWQGYQSPTARQSALRTKRVHAHVKYERTRRLTFSRIQCRSRSR